MIFFVPIQNREDAWRTTKHKKSNSGAKLEEEDMSRGSMLRRSAAAAFGLTVLTASPAALAAG